MIYARCFVLNRDLVGTEKAVRARENPVRDVLPFPTIRQYRLCFFLFPLGRLRQYSLLPL